MMTGGNWALHVGVALALLAPSATGVGALPLTQTVRSNGVGIIDVDSRLYRHCHIAGSRAFVRCMTADPWSPEHMELDRRAGRLYHDGGPIDASRKAKHLPPLHEPN